jgi:hypothetical protein
MNEIEIKEKLDMLAEFYAQKDALEISKRDLLNEIQVPAEIEQIVNKGLELAKKIESDMRARIAEYNKKIDKELDEVSVPDELRDALAEIERRRAEIMSRFSEVEKQRAEIAGQKKSNEAAEIEATQKQQDQLRAEIDAKTKKVYADIAQKKQEIEIEFSGKADDVSANIARLESEIKADMKRHAAEKLEANPKAKDLSVKGKFFHAVYVRGRVTWNTDKMDAWCNDHPFLKEARKEGEPSITLRKI